jgi:hypothetical protein
MRMILRDGFMYPSQPYRSDDQFDQEVTKAAARRVVVQDVQSIRMGAGGLRIRLADGPAACAAQHQTGWCVAAERTLTSALKPMDGHAAIVADGVAYNSLDVEEDQ